MRVVIVANSNPYPRAKAQTLELLKSRLESFGLDVLMSPYIFPADGASPFFSASPEAKADVVNQAFADPEVTAVLDISGGDMGNEVLPFLDYAAIAESKAKFWGYSDLTTVINAIYAKTGKQSILYQVRNLLSYSTGEMPSEEQLFHWNYEFIQGSCLSGTVIGGNIRCLLKLAGTEYMPDFRDNILFLEANSGDEARVKSYFNQLQQLGVFAKIKGLVLGTFTELEGKHGEILLELAKNFMGEKPLVKTADIGHSPYSRALRLGGWLELG